MDEAGLSRYVDQPLEARATDRDVAPAEIAGAVVQGRLIAASH
jgi:hypothetical protein